MSLPGEWEMDTWLTWQANIIRRSPKTVKRQREVLIVYLKWCADHGFNPMLDMPIEAIEAFISRDVWVGKGSRRSVAGMKYEAGVLRRWYAWLTKRRHIEEDYAEELRAPDAPEAKPKPLPDEHWIALWCHPWPPRRRNILTLGGVCGLRIGEMVVLTGEHITPTLIEDFMRKGAKEDTTPWREMVEVLADHMPQLIGRGGVPAAVEALLGSRRTGRPVVPTSDVPTLRRIFYSMCDEASVPRYKPHQLRATATTNLLRCGVPIQVVSELLCHENIQTTKKHYAQAGIRELREWRALQRLRGHTPHAHDNDGDGLEDTA